ncbi:MAG: hypothetical protein M1829_003594 [Trizodia sp. TS-e1964]|nr:MAG: hypothetical protein M1829_003594 [Trizodia sp. TS-e1964]
MKLSQTLLFLGAAVCISAAPAPGPFALDVGYGPNTLPNPRDRIASAANRMLKARQLAPRAKKIPDTAAALEAATAAFEAVLGESLAYLESHRGERKNPSPEYSRLLEAAVQANLAVGLAREAFVLDTSQPRGKRLDQAKVLLQQTMLEATMGTPGAVEAGIQTPPSAVPEGATEETVMKQQKLLQYIRELSGERRIKARQPSTNPNDKDTAATLKAATAVFEAASREMVAYGMAHPNEAATGAPAYMALVRKAGELLVALDPLREAFIIDETQAPGKRLNQALVLLLYRIGQDSVLRGEKPRIDIQVVHEMTDDQGSFDMSALLARMTPEEKAKHGELIRKINQLSGEN